MLLASIENPQGAWGANRYDWKPTTNFPLRVCATTKTRAIALLKQKIKCAFEHVLAMEGGCEQITNTMLEECLEMHLEMHDIVVSKLKWTPSKIKPKVKSKKFK